MVRPGSDTSADGTHKAVAMGPGLGIVRLMTYDEALAVAAGVDDPDDYLEVVNDMLLLRWRDGALVVRGGPIVEAVRRRAHP